MRAGKQRATATSIDAMSTRTSARTTTLCMEPEGHVAETACVVLPKRYFIPKCPLARGPPDGESTPRRHGGAGPPHSSEPTACRRTALRRGGGTA